MVLGGGSVSFGAERARLDRGPRAARDAGSARGRFAELADVGAALDPETAARRALAAMAVAPDLRGRSGQEAVVVLLDQSSGTFGRGHEGTRCLMARSTGGAAGLVLFTLATAQFLMTLDSSVMNVSIAQVAEDVGTTVTGIQTAITLYTLVMATMMITGGKIGSLIGRREAFAIGCVIYACGSFVTSIAQSLTVLIIGWSVLEGLGAALIMPAIVALVASNFATNERPRAYGLVASAGAIAVAAGPLIGGFVTTYWTWRLRVRGRGGAGRRHPRAHPQDRRRRARGAVPPRPRRLGPVRGRPRPRPSSACCGPGSGGGSSPARAVRPGWGCRRRSGWCSPAWWCSGCSSPGSSRVLAAGREPLVRPDLLRNARLAGGLTMFFFQFMIQAGLFFVVPLFLSIALGLSALQTGVRLLPLSVSLLIAAVGIPRFFPTAAPREVVRWGLARDAARHRRRSWPRWR